MPMLSAAALAFVLPLAFTGERAGNAVRAAASFPEIEISKAGSEHEWPFSVDHGKLICVAWGGQKVVLFMEPWREDVPQEFGNMTMPGSVIVSSNPWALLASVEDRALYLPFDTLETLIKRLAPFETMGTKLCTETAKQPPQKKI